MLSQITGISHSALFWVAGTRAYSRQVKACLEFWGLLWNPVWNFIHTFMYTSMSVHGWLWRRRRHMHAIWCCAKGRCRGGRSNLSIVRSIVGLCNKRSEFSVGILSERNLNAVGMWYKPYSNQCLPYRNPIALSHRIDPLQKMLWEQRFIGQIPLQEHETFPKNTSCMFLKNILERGVLWESFVFLEWGLTYAQFRSHRFFWRGSMPWDNAIPLG